MPNVPPSIGWQVPFGRTGYGHRPAFGRVMVVAVGTLHADEVPAVPLHYFYGLSDCYRHILTNISENRRFDNPLLQRR